MKILYLIATLKGYGVEKSHVEITLNYTEIIPVYIRTIQGVF